MRAFSVEVVLKTMVLDRFHPGDEHTEKRRSPRTSSNAFVLSIFHTLDHILSAHLFFQSLLQLLAATQVQPSGTDFISAALCIFWVFSLEFLCAAWEPVIPWLAIPVHDHTRKFQAVNSHGGKPWPVGYINIPCNSPLIGLSLG